MTARPAHAPVNPGGVDTHLFWSSTVCFTAFERIRAASAPDPLRSPQEQLVS